MLTGGKALETLLANADAPEHGQSKYWKHQVSQFSVSGDGTINGSTVLGNVSRNRSAVTAFAHWVLQTPYRFMGRRYGSFKECERLGRRIAERQNRQFTHDMMRQVLSLALILDGAPTGSDNDCHLVIGDGFGVLSALFLLAVPSRRTITINLTKPLLVDLAYIQLAVPHVGIALVSNEHEMMEALSAPEINLIAVRADDISAIESAPIGVAANVCSMQEMEAPVIAEYFHVLRNNTAAATAFYCANKWSKTFQDGKTSRFEEYPWRPGDEVLCDAPCPWSQFYYDKTPPFYSYRRDPGRLIWHRLALMENAARER